VCPGSSGASRVSGMPQTHGEQDPRAGLTPQPSALDLTRFREDGYQRWRREFGDHLEIPRDLRTQRLLYEAFQAGYWHCYGDFREKILYVPTV
jgi:hypothetical protein